MLDLGKTIPEYYNLEMVNPFQEKNYKVGNLFNQGITI